MNNIIPVEVVENRIFIIRGRKVMIDRDLAELYEVETKYLNRQVKRNISRFPPEFMFRLTDKETRELVTNCHRFRKKGYSSAQILRCQNVTSSHGGRRYLPYVFTEHGVAMLATVLKSKRAVAVSILIIKAFVKLRKLILSHTQLAHKISQLERQYGKHEIEIQAVFKMIKKLLKIEKRPKKKIGFLRDREGCSQSALRKSVSR